MSMRPECLDNGVPPVTKELVEATVRAQERMLLRRVGGAPPSPQAGARDVPNS